MTGVNYANEKIPLLSGIFSFVIMTDYLFVSTRRNHGATEADGSR